MKQNLVITIGRQFGSGGREIGKILAEMLHFSYYDKELIQEASKASGLCPECFERADEKAPNRFLNALSKGWMSGVSGIPSSGEWSDEMIFKVQSDVIRDIALRGSAVIVGRCADYILKDYDNVVRVFVHGPYDFCLEQAMRVNAKPENEMRKLMEKRDKYRGEYYKHYTGQNWYDARNYDLCLDSSKLGFEGCVEAIKAYMAVRGLSIEK